MHVMHTLISSRQRNVLEDTRSLLIAHGGTRRRRGTLLMTIFHVPRQQNTPHTRLISDWLVSTFNTYRLNKRNHHCPRGVASSRPFCFQFMLIVNTQKCSKAFTRQAVQTINCTCLLLACALAASRTQVHAGNERSRNVVR